MKTNNIRNQRNAGFTLVEIMIVVAIIGLLAAIAIPNFIRAREKSQENACINNLRQLDGALQQWVLEGKKASTDTYAITDLEPFIKLQGGALPTCPSGGAAYAIGATCAVSMTCASTIATHVLP